MLALPATAQTFPKFTGFVVDDANVLPPDVEADLTAKLDALQRDTKRQLVVATIADVQGYPLSDYGYALGRAWAVGLKDANNGIILFIAPNEPKGGRGPRIEVGYGLEPIVTDALASQIINEAMIPPLTNGGDIPGAMTAGTDALIAQLRASPEEAQAKVDAAIAAFDAKNRRSERGSGGGLGTLIFWGIIVLFVILPMLRGLGGRRYRRGGGSVAGAIGEVILWSALNAASDNDDDGGGWGGFGGGGSGGGGGWGGGGFSGGGGGSFGGGGASGGW